MTRALRRGSATLEHVICVAGFALAFGAVVLWLEDLWAAAGAYMGSVLGGGVL
ncbi:MAG: hypothetical protein ABIO70_23305 [Pseudomonadota bacterium]